MTTSVDLLTASVAVVWIAAGESLRARVGFVTTAPISSAAAIALVLVPVGLGHTTMAVGATLAGAVTLGLVLGMLVRAVRGLPQQPVDLGAQGAALAVLILVIYVVPGVAWVLTRAAGPQAPVVFRAVTFVGVALMATGVEGLCATLVRSRRWLVPVQPLLRGVPWPGWLLGLAVVATSASIALAVPVVGPLVAFLFVWPLIQALVGLARQGKVRATFRESVQALSNLTEVSGLTRPGHAVEVATLSADLARRLRMPSDQVEAVTFAGLLHDLGQMALAAPIPEGATVIAAPVDQAAIAGHSTQIAQRAGVSDAVLAVLRHQAAPFRNVREFGEDVPLGARILKVANAYSDYHALTGQQRGAALERIHLGLGYEYDPEVVDALERSVSGRPSAARGWVDVRRG